MLGAALVGIALACFTHILPCLEHSLRSGPTTSINTELNSGGHPWDTWLRMHKDFIYGPQRENTSQKHIGKTPETAYVDQANSSNDTQTNLSVLLFKAKKNERLPSWFHAGGFLAPPVAISFLDRGKEMSMTSILAITVMLDLHLAMQVYAIPHFEQLNGFSTVKIQNLFLSCRILCI